MSEHTRRQFLGAAATLGALPATTQSAVGQEEPNDGGEDQYTQEVKHGGFTGLLAANQPGDVEVGVSNHPHQTEGPIALELSLNGIGLSTAFGPDQARDIAESLLTAADETEQWREEHWDDQMHELYGGKDD